MITPTAGLPGWLNSRHVLPAGLAVALLVLGVAAGFVAYEHREIRANALDRNRLFARVLEEPIHGHDCVNSSIPDPARRGSGRRAHVRGLRLLHAGASHLSIGLSVLFTVKLNSAT